MTHATLAVIGAGAAGSFAAMFAAQTLKERGHPASVVVCETRRQPGAKIRVSGGGRCNVLPGKSELADFESRGSHHVVRNVLASWPLADVRHFFEKSLGLALQDEPTGKVFPASNTSRDVVDCILRGVSRSGAVLQTATELRTVDVIPTGHTRVFRLTFADGTSMTSDLVIMATGGLSMPRTGSDGHGLTLLKQLGHRIEVTAPALVPLVGHGSWEGALSGLSVECSLRALQNGRELGRTTGSLLFTHRGISGPVVLDISRYVTLAAAQGKTPEAPVQIRATWGQAGLASDPRLYLKRMLSASPASPLASVIRSELPRRLADTLIVLAGLEDRQASAVSSLSRLEHSRLLNVLCDLPLTVAGSEGYRVAECTTGGVALDEVAWRSLESRRTPGLYLCGEVLDVTGRLGGFNFLWAWISGRKAGMAAAQHIIQKAESLSSSDAQRYAQACQASTCVV